MFGIWNTPDLFPLPNHSISISTCTHFQRLLLGTHERLTPPILGSFILVDRTLVKDGLWCVPPQSTIVLLGYGDSFFLVFYVAVSLLPDNLKTNGTPHRTFSTVKKGTGTLPVSKILSLSVSQDHLDAFRV